MKKKQEGQVKEEAFGSTESRRELEHKDEVFGSTYVTKEDLYRIVCGVQLLANGLQNEKVQTIKERGVEIQMLVNKLDQMAQRVKNVDGNIILQLKQTHWEVTRD